MKTVKIWESLGVGWTKFKQRPWYLFGVAVAVGGLFVFSIGDALVTALAYLLYGGYIAFMIKVYNGESVVFDDLFSLDNRWINFAFLGLVKSLLIMIGFLCFIIPGIILSVRWMFAEMLVIDKGMRPIEALQASSALTKGYRWKLFGFSLVVGFLFLVGLLFFVVGAFVPAVVSVFAMIKIYYELSGQVAAEEPVTIPEEVPQSV